MYGFHATRIKKLKMVDALREFGFDVPELNEALFMSEDSMIRMGYPPVRIEVKTSIAGAEIDEAIGAHVVTRREELVIPTINLQQLIQNERASRRHKELDDLERLPESDR
jgi:hypothetical protein